MKNEKDLFETNNEEKDIQLNGKPLKVTEEKPAGFSSYRLEKLFLTALITLTIALPISNHISKADTPANDASFEEQVETVAVTEKTQGNPNALTFNINGIFVEITDPEISLEGEEATYKIPEGYKYDGYNCYRLSCEGEAPEGYVKGADDKTLYQVDSEMKYQVKEGCILVGDKSIEVRNAIEREINGEKSYIAPSGYWQSGEKIYRITDAIPLTDENGNWINIYEETEPIPIYHADGTYSYGAPEGYYYFDDTCYKIEVLEQTKGR